MTEFKDRLKQLRKERGLTQKELAEALKISPSTIGMIESGKRTTKLGLSEIAVRSFENEKRFPSGTSLQLLSQFFNVSTDYLLGSSDQRTPESQFDLSQITTDELITELFRRIPIG